MAISVNRIGGLKGDQGRMPPGSKFFHFHAVFGKKEINAPTLGVAHPPRKILDSPMNRPDCHFDPDGSV